MISVAEIIQTLPKLNEEELGYVEGAFIEEYRFRRFGIVFDDSYGVLTEAELMAGVAEVFAGLDEIPSHHISAS